MEVTAVSAAVLAEVAEDSADSEAALPAAAEPQQDFTTWLDGVKVDARAQGISQNTLDKVFIAISLSGVCPYHEGRNDSSRPSLGDAHISTLRDRFTRMAAAPSPV